MPARKILRRILFILLITVLVLAARYAWVSFPIISGFAAKNACSCIFIQGRDLASVKAEELGMFPLSTASLRVDLRDSSVRATVLGVAMKKAIYRKGLGCTLVNDIPEQSIRAQLISAPDIAAFPDTAAWPGGTQSAVFDTMQIRRALQAAMNEKDVHTRAVVVVHDGRIIGEQYAAGYSAATPFLGWSMGKSFVGALVGILQMQQRLDVASKVPFPEWQQDDRRDITIEQLLQQTSGLDFVEDYRKSSDVTRMLFQEGDMARYAMKRSLKHTPGTVFNYSGGNTNLLSYLVRRTTGSAYHRFPYEQLFHRIGMYHTFFEPDASGTYVGSSYIYATARDYARFGWLYANDGVWNGTRVLPEGWVRRSAISPAANKSGNYGYQFWLNGRDPENPEAPEFPGVPADMFYADGFGGQRIYIIPSMKLVLVRLGLKLFDERAFLKQFLLAFEKGGTNKPLSSHPL